MRLILGTDKDVVTRKKLLVGSDTIVCNAYTVSPLSIQSLCELHRHVASPNDIIFSIRRLHSKHHDRVHTVGSNLFTMLRLLKPVLENSFV